MEGEQGQRQEERQEAMERLVASGEKLMREREEFLRRHQNTPARGEDTEVQRVDSDIEFRIPRQDERDRRPDHRPTRRWIEGEFHDEDHRPTRRWSDGVKNMEQYISLTEDRGLPKPFQVERGSWENSQGDHQRNPFISASNPTGYRREETFHQEGNRNNRNPFVPANTRMPLPGERWENRVPSYNRMGYDHQVGDGIVPSYSNSSSSNYKIKVPLYDGKGSLTDYLVQFDRVSRMNGWNDWQKADQLAIHLRDPAREVLSDITDEVSESYVLLVQALKQRFEPENQTEMYKSHFRSRKRKTNESIPELVQALKRLVRQAYPYTDKTTQGSLAMDAFIDSLVDSEIRWKVRQSRPRDLDEAAQITIELEAFMAAEKDKKSVRAVEKVSTSADPQLKEMIQQLQQELKEIKGQQGGKYRKDQGGERKCYKCGEPGHLANRCPIKSIVCYNCHEEGHKSFECPKKPENQSN